MPEDDLETNDLKEQLDKSAEDVRGGWLTYLALTTAIIAVLAAIASLESGTYSNSALLEKNEAVLLQAKASDQWAYYQAKGIKRNISSAEADELQSLNAQTSAEARKEADRYGTEQDEISKAAKDLEKQVTEHSEASEREMEHHHRFAYAVTTFQVAIALSAIAAITRRRMLWIVGLGISIVGLLCFVDGMWLMF